MTRSTFSPAISPACLVASRCELSKYAGTVITTSLMLTPSLALASATILRSTSALTCSGARSLPFTSIRTLPLGPSLTVKGLRAASSLTSFQLRPMKRLTSNRVAAGFRAA